MHYENTEKLNRQGLLFVALHTLVLFMFAFDFEVFM